MNRDAATTATPLPSAPLVSVVMPAWNCARYIGRAIDSVRAQTHADLELIIVDDASTDDTVAMVRIHADARVRLLRNDRNRGPACCRNAGIEAARGEWIALLDADDWFCPARLETLLTRARLHGADAIADDLYIVRDGRTEPHTTLFTEAGCKIADGGWMRAADVLAHEIGALKPLFRRALHSVHGHRYDESLRYGEDCRLYLSWLAGGARMLVARDAHYCLRRGDTGSLTTARVAMAHAALALNRSLLADAALRLPPQARKALVRRTERARDMLVFYEVVCPLRALRFADAVTALLRSPRFLLVALKRTPDIIGRRLRRLVFHCRRYPARGAGHAAPLRQGPT